jgi:hypothetical protein
VGLVSVIVFFIVLPLDFSQIGVGWLNTLLKAILIAGMAGTSIGVVVHVSRAASGAQYAPAK